MLIKSHHRFHNSIRGRAVAKVTPAVKESVGELEHLAWVMEEPFGALEEPMGALGEPTTLQHL